MNNFFLDAPSLKRALPPDKTITLVGGCFDLLHIGHVSLLERASKFADILVVAVLSDDYVRRYKGAGRPIICQAQRAKMVASTRFVDYTYISDVSTSSGEILSLLRPTCVVFGQEAGKESQVAERVARVSKHSPSTEIFVLSRHVEPPISTGLIIERIFSLQAA